MNPKQRFAHLPNWEVVVDRIVRNVQAPFIGLWSVDGIYEEPGMWAGLVVVPVGFTAGHLDTLRQMVLKQIPKPTKHDLRCCLHLRQVNLIRKTVNSVNWVNIDPCPKSASRMENWLQAVRDGQGVPMEGVLNQDIYQVPAETVLRRICGKPTGTLKLAIAL